MRILPGRGARVALLLAVAVPAVLVAVASLPWRGERAREAPRVVQAGEGAGPLRAGAAAVAFSGLPADVPIAGFARLSYASDGIAEPVGARALVLDAPGLKVALVSAEILLVPEALEAAVTDRVRDLGLRGVVLGATHTHAGPGGFWDHAFGEGIATGPYDPRVFEVIADGIVRAIREAHAALAPARASVAHGHATDLAKSRSGGGQEGRLTVVRLERPDGAPVGEVAVFAAHPTILGGANRRISGDWPGRFMAAARGVRLFFEGALGDQSVQGPTATPEAFAAALAARADALDGGAPDPSPALGYAAVEVVLPAPAPGAAPAFLRPAASNLARDAFPRKATVEAVRIGEVILVATPAEPVASVAAAWRASLPAGTELVSLSGGYVGYVEAPERMSAGAGETVRTYFGPELAARLGEAVRLAAETVAGTGRSAARPGGATRPAAAR